MRRLTRVIAAAAGALTIGLLPLVASGQSTSELDIANITSTSVEITVKPISNGTNDAILSKSIGVWLGATRVFCQENINPPVDDDGDQPAVTIRLRNLDPGRSYTVRGYDQSVCSILTYDTNPRASTAFDTLSVTESDQALATATPTPVPELQILPAIQVNDVVSTGDAVYVLRYNSHGETWPQQPIAVLYDDTNGIVASRLTRYYDLEQRCIRPTCATPPRGDGPGFAIIYKPDGLTIGTPKLGITDRHGWTSDLSTPSVLPDLNAVLLTQLKLLEVEWGTNLTEGEHANGHGTEYLLAIAPWLTNLELDVISKTTPPKEPERTEPQRSGQAQGMQLLGLPPDTSNSLMVAGMALAGITAGSVAGKRTAGTYGAASAVVPLSIGLLELHLPAFGLLVFLIMLIAVTLWRKTAS